MKKSISIWSFNIPGGLKEKLALAKQAGFAGLEIDIAAEGPLTLESGEKEIAEVRQLADDADIELSGLATGLYWSANGASEDSATRERAAHILKRQVEIAQQLAIDAILVVPASVGVDFIPGAEIVPYEQAYRHATTLIRDALPLAEKCGVRIGIENVWNKFLTSPLEMRSFLDQFDSPFVGAYLDVGNVLATGYPEHWIEILGSRIFRVHFKDYRRAVGAVDGFCDLLSGDVNWPAVMNALRAANYQGWIAGEMIPPVPFYKHAPEVLIHNTSRAMDAIFAL